MSICRSKRCLKEARFDRLYCFKCTSKLNVNGDTFTNQMSELKHSIKNLKKAIIDTMFRPICEPILKWIFGGKK